MIHMMDALTSIMEQTTTVAQRRVLARQATGSAHIQRKMRVCAPLGKRSVIQANVIAPQNR
jgi:hypothetical protein